MARVAVRDDNQWRYTGWRGPLEGPEFRDVAQIVYSTDSWVTWLPFNGATFESGASFELGLVVETLGTASRSNTLSEHQASPSTSGSRVEWWVGDPDAGGTLLRNDDYQAPYDASASVVTTGQLGGPGSLVVTARCVYPSDGRVDDRVATASTTTPSLLIVAGPAASALVTSAVVSLTATNTVTSLTVQYRTAAVGEGSPGAWVSVTNSGLSTVTPSVAISGLTAATNYEYRVPTGGVVDVHGQTTQDVTVRSFTTASIGAVTPAYVDSWIPAGFPDSMSTGIRALGLTPEDLTVHSGNFTTSSTNQLIENRYIVGRMLVQHGNVTVRGCRILGDQSGLGRDACLYSGPDGQGPTYENCEIGPELKYVTLHASTAINASSLRIDHTGDPFESVGLPVGIVGQGGTGDTNHTYLVLGVSTGLMEQVRTNGKTQVSPGLWQYTIESHTGGGWTQFVAYTTNVLKFAHTAGEPIAYHRRQEDGELAGNGVGGSTSTKHSSQVIRCDIHGVNDGVKGGSTPQETLVIDSLIRETVCIPVAHLDGVQGFRAGGCNVIHTTFAMTPSPNSVIKYGDFQTNGKIKFCFAIGGAQKSFQVSVSGTLRVSFNRFGLALKGSTVLDSSALTEVRDNRYAFTGTAHDGTSVTAGGVVSGTIGTPAADRDGNGTGTATAWGTGYNTDPDWNASYALPDNPEYVA